jgi:ribosomal protein S18 acetylase RimI-like enzyme
MIKIDENNYIEWKNSPWNGKPLGNVSSVDITDFKADSLTLALELLSQFNHKTEAISYISSRINSQDMHLVKALGMSGYSMVEIAMKVTGIISKLKIDNSQFNKYKFIQTSSLSDDIPIIVDFAKKYFNFGKFHEDPLIDRIAAETRNSNMVLDLIKTSKIYIGKVNNEIIGFMILKESDKFIEFQLGGIHPGYRHLSYSFWNKIFEEYKNKGIGKFTTTISAGNTPVVNLYSRFGFKFAQTFYGYRKLKKHY